MPESDFEKQVQQELGQLKLRPSAEVWQNVENELRKKKRRRVIIIFFLLAGLALLGYPGYRLFNHDGPELAENKTSINKKAIITSDKELPAGDNPVNQPTKENSAGAAPSTDLNSNINTQPAIDKVNNEQRSHETSIDKSIVQKNQPSSQNTALSEQTTPTASNGQTRTSGSSRTLSGTNKEKTKILNTTPEESSAGRVDKKNEIAGSTLIAQPNNNEIVATNETVKSTQVIDSIETGQKTDSVMAKIDTETPKKNPPVRTPKFRFGLELSAGVSSSREYAFIGGMKAASLDQVAYAAPPSGVGTSVPINGLPPVPPSVIEPGFSFRLGAFGEWKFSKRSSLITGLQYSYMSTKIHVGAYRDSAFSFINYASQSVDVRALYRGTQNTGSANAYTNNYHFISMPITYQWQMSKSEKLPVLWNFGVGLKYLVATNGLMYSNAQGGIYYKDKDAYNRFQFNMNTSLFLRFGNQRRNTWMIGPELSMDMTRLIKDAYGNQQYLLYGGVTGRWYLPTGKK